MSNMPSHRITVRIPEALGQRLSSRSRIKGQTESELVREALENYLGQSKEERSAYELAQKAGLIGSVKRAPKDLSTNRHHFEGFGRSGPGSRSEASSGRYRPAGRHSLQS
jgi:metal-responsive CopG/Arc/MetJ family transcriptional regulator